MGFMGGGGNIASATALPPSSFVYCKYQIVHGNSLSYFLCLPEASVSGCGANPGLSVLYLLSAEYSEVMCGARPGTLVT